jgi:hypothetical protein
VYPNEAFNVLFCHQSSGRRLSYAIHAPVLQAFVMESSIRKSVKLMTIFLSVLLILAMTSIKVNEYGSNATQLSLVNRIIARTYQSFLERIFVDGFFPESVYLDNSEDCYSGYYYRTAYVAGVVFVDNNEVPKAESLLDFIVSHQSEVDYLPHVSLEHVNTMNEKQKNVSDLLCTLSNERKCSQKFKATQSELTGIELFLESDECNGDIIAEIRSVADDSNPESGKLMSTFTIGEEHFGNWNGTNGGRWRYSDGFSYLKLKDPVSLTLGDDYFIVLTTNSTSNVIVYGSRDPTSYRGMEYHMYVSSPTGWMPNENEDVGFELCSTNTKNYYSLVEQTDTIGWTSLLYEYIYENCGHNAKFRDKYYSFIRDVLNWCKSNRYNQQLKLVRNPNLEHTIGYVDAYDIYTNALLAVAYEGMSKIAEEKGDMINRDLWYETYLEISEGINTNLATTYDFSQSYLDVESEDNALALFAVHGSSDYFCGQTWKSQSASTSTKIERIDVTLSRVGAPPPITLSVYEYSGDREVPRGRLLGSTALSYEYVKQSPNWISFNFPESIEIKELTTYYFELTCPRGDDDNRYFSYGSPVDRYPHGNAWNELGSLTSDLAFRTYSNSKGSEPTTTLNVYEQFITASDGAHHLDFSWMTLAPYVVGWDRLDEARLYNTWMAKRSSDWACDGSLLPLSYPNEPQKSLTKDIAWDILWSHHMGLDERVQGEIDFIGRSTLTALPFYESYMRFEDNKIHPLDAGNGEQSGWMLYSLYKLNNTTVP